MSDNLRTKHNKAITHMNFMRLYQERFQDIQEFHDQYMGIWHMQGVQQNWA